MDEDDVPVEALALEYTKHAVQVMAERRIPEAWVARAVAEPEWRVPDPDDPELARFFRRIRERGGRALRVVVNTRSTPWRVVSAFLDRNARKEP